MTNKIVPWEDMETPDLANEFSDYHKAVHGYRPRYVNFEDRTELLHQLNRLDQFMAYRKSTPEGRELLKKEGWIV